MISQGLQPDFKTVSLNIIPSQSLGVCYWAQQCGQTQEWLTDRGTEPCTSRKSPPQVNALARLGSARLGSARLGSARLGSARLGSPRLVSSRLVSSRLVFHGLKRKIKVGVILSGTREIFIRCSQCSYIVHFIPFLKSIYSDNIKLD